MKKNKYKIIISIWPFAILLLSGICFQEITWLIGLLAVLPPWIYAFCRTSEE